MHVLTADIADGVRWLADLFPLIAAVLGVLVLFEIAILLGSLIATLEARSEPAERMAEAGPANPPLESSRPRNPQRPSMAAPTLSPDALLEERPGRHL